MPAPFLQHLTVGGAAATTGAPRRMAFWDWPCQGTVQRSTVVCVHGLSRQGRDFDTLARSLCQRSRVVAVDVAGRGHSDWLADPMGYQMATYSTDLAALVAHLKGGAPDVPIDWVGTSMGGLIGMALAAQPHTGLRRLVLNDVGPLIQWEALMRIASYLGLNPSFDSEQAAEDYLASISAGFGPHTPEQWRALTRPLLRLREGRWWLHYDPAIAVPFKAMTATADETSARQIVQAGESALWGLYDAIRTPTLLLRGEQSDLLTAETALHMTQRGPKATLATFSGVGHAPTLVADDQVAIVRNFLWAD